MEDSVDSKKLSVEHRYRLLRRIEYTNSSELEDNIDPMELVAEYRDMLLRCFVYTNTKKSELERALFRTALFILNNGMETCVQNKRQALLILAADQDLLFKEHDSVYLDRCINGPVYVHNNDVVRKQYTKQGKDALIRLSLLRGFQHQQTEGVSDKKKVANDILKKIVEVSGREGVYRWLFSRPRIGITEQNVSFYKEIYSFFPDGYKRDDVLPDDERERIKFIDEWLNYKEADKKQRIQRWSLEAFDIDVCRKEFETLLPQCTSYPFWNNDFCEIVVCCAIELARLKAEMKRIPKRPISYVDNRRVESEYPAFIKRYQQLSSLEGDFLKPIPSRLRNSKLKCEWRFGSLSYRKEAEGICALLQEYYKGIETPLRGDNEVLINRSAFVAEWFSFKETRSLGNEYRPIVYLAMLRAFKKSIAYDTTGNQISVTCSDFSKGIEKRSNHIPCAKQRLAEIKLLDQLHAYLMLSDEECKNSWNEFFSLNEKEIKSAEEELYWREKLDGKYESLPVIGFQLCLKDNLAEVLRVWSSFLSYGTFLQKPRDGLYQFLDSHGLDLKTLGVKIVYSKDCGIQNAIKAYRKQWSVPSSTDEMLLEKLKSIEKALYVCKQIDFSILELCATDEMRLVALEASVQYGFAMQAYRKLLNWSKKAYDIFGYKDTLYEQKPQGGFAIREITGPPRT